VNLSPEYQLLKISFCIDKNANSFKQADLKSQKKCQKNIAQTHKN
jgi:hypothetical protein